VAESDDPATIPVTGIARIEVFCSAKKTAFCGYWMKGSGAGHCPTGGRSLPIPATGGLGHGNVSAQCQRIPAPGLHMQAGGRSLSKNEGFA